MTETAWLYHLIHALDELVQVSIEVLEPDQDALSSAVAWADLMDKFQDAINVANEAGSDVPNIAEWIRALRDES